MKYLFLLIIFIIIFSSCQPTINEKSISVDIGKISSLPPETLFTSARIIPLETTDSSLMAQIDKVLVHKKNNLPTGCKTKYSICFQRQRKFSI